MRELPKICNRIKQDLYNLYKYVQDSVPKLNNDLHNSIVSDGGIGKNLVNKEDIIKDVYLNESGSLEVAGGWSVTNYIRLKANTSYSLSPKQNKSACIGLYDESKTLTRTIPLSNLYATGVFTTKSNEVYVRISNETASIGDVQLEEGTSTTSYEPYIMSNEQLTTKYENLGGLSFEKDASNNLVVTDSTGSKYTIAMTPQ